MEILIPGLLLVALMVYASTKIKKNAAAAYDEETVATDHLSITKPEGMIIPVKSEKDVLFEAYSRDFGIDEAGEIRQIAAVVRRYEGTDIDSVKLAIEQENSEVREIAGKVGDQRMIRQQFLRYERDAEIRETVKLVQTNDAVTELRISALTYHDDINLAKVEQMLDSFRAN
ncbi:hypothetical protein BH24ACI3_BH24ACI3_03120 [soil metagenome]